MEKINIQRAPCASCPYRKDVPSGIWATEEYDKILPYDNETMFQPARIFLCHQQNGCLCRGWLDTHGTELLAIRFGCIKGEVDPADITKAIDEGPAVEVFETAAQAAKHGRKSIKRPGVKAKQMVEQLTNKRSRK